MMLYRTANIILEYVDLLVHIRVLVQYYSTHTYEYLDNDGGSVGGSIVFELRPHAPIKSQKLHASAAPRRSRRWRSQSRRSDRLDGAGLVPVLCCYSMRADRTMPSRSGRGSVARHSGSAQRGGHG